MDRDLNNNTKPTNSLLSRVVDANDEGIQQLQQCKYIEALTAFQKGLIALNDRFGVGPSVQSDNGSSSAVASVTATRPPINLADHASYHLSSVAMPDPGNDDVFLLFNRAISLSPRIKEMDENCEALNQIVAVVLTYNVGLVHHLEGLAFGNSNLLIRSLEFYSLAYTALRVCLSSTWNNTIERFTGTHHFALLALVNNLGHIHAYFRSLSDVGICRDELAFRLAELFVGAKQHAAADASAASSQALPPPHPNNEQYKVFYHNVFYFPMAELTSAPAA